VLELDRRKIERLSLLSQSYLTPPFFFSAMATCKNKQIESFVRGSWSFSCWYNVEVITKATVIRWSFFNPGKSPRNKNVALFVLWQASAVLTATFYRHYQNIQQLIFVVFNLKVFVFFITMISYGLRHRKRCWKTFYRCHVLGEVRMSLKVSGGVVRCCCHWRFVFWRDDSTTSSTEVALQSL
jgi:hypothetical protein